MTLSKNNSMRISAKSVKMMLLFIIVPIIIISIFYFHPFSKESTVSITSQINLHPPVTVLTGQNQSIPHVTLIKLVNSTIGISGGYNSKGLPVSFNDTNHLSLALYKGYSINGTIIAANVTNISSQNVTIEEMQIMGANPAAGGGENFLLNAIAIGCTHSYHYTEDIGPYYPNGTHIPQFTNMTSVCDNPAPLPSPTTLMPGKSLIAFITENFTTANLPPRDFSAVVGYKINGYGDVFSVTAPTSMKPIPITSVQNATFSYSNQTNPLP